MISLSEYSVLAANVYNNFRSRANRLPDLPSGWDVVKDHSINSADGFTGIAYKNGNNIVISFEGTKFDPSNNPGTTMSEISTDAGLWLGSGSTRLLDAAKLYEQIQNDPKYKGCNISFTGHSLGAGIASIMAVWFNKPATVFDTAPFWRAVINDKYAAFLNMKLKYEGFPEDPALAAFIAPTANTELMVKQRLSLVNAYYVQGELLNQNFGSSTFVVNPSQNIQLSVGGGDKVSSVQLHSMELTGGVSFNLNDISSISSGDTKGKDKLVAAADALVYQNDSLATGIIASANNWFVQAGSTGLQANGAGFTGNEVLIGGGSGNDLIGGSSQNVLIAGSGNDTLKGGKGVNYFQAGFGGDLLVGQGSNDKFEFVTQGSTGTDSLFALHHPCPAQAPAGGRAGAHKRSRRGAHCG